MDFISNKEAQIQEMLSLLGITSVEELFQTIPAKLRLKAPTQNDGISEFEGLRLMEKLAEKNTYSKFQNYLGAGAYEHHVPAIVNAICSKSEFLTSYTPYQPEASQGMLQCIFEYQSAICALTGLDVANASLYDGASACAEAALMALRCQKNRNKVVVCQSVHPHYREVVKQYLQHPEIELVTLPVSSEGTISTDQLKSFIDENTAAIMVQYPNFFGVVEDIASLSKIAKEKGVFTIIAANPLVYGLFPSAAELGAEIAVGDTQPFGLPLQFGGPYSGYICCKNDLVRQLPGRIVGETVDTKGRRGFVLTLQVREQHIRREKATSNICTNQALAALASLIAILWYGKEGIKKLAMTNYQRAHYLRDKLLPFTEKTSFTKQEFFNEFVIKFKKPIHEVQKRFRAQGIEPGLSLDPFFPEYKGCLLVAVTETKSLDQLNQYIDVAKELV